MNFFTIEKATGKIISVSSYEQAVPGEYIVRAVKEGELQKFLNGFSKLDFQKDALAKPNITDAVILRQQLITAVTQKLNALAVENGYVDANDAMSFINSENKLRKADAAKMIQLRDEARDEVDALVSSLGNQIDISLEAAMGKLSVLK